MRTAAYSPGIGISAIGLYEPPWILSNEWFDGTLPSKFVQHTGIESRRVSLDDEVTMAARALRNLQRATGCRLRDCAGVVFAASSLLPSPIGKKYAGKDGASGRITRLRRSAVRQTAGRRRRQRGRDQLGLQRLCQSLGDRPLPCGRSGKGTVHPGRDGQSHEQDHRLLLPADGGTVRRLRPGHAARAERQRPIPGAFCIVVGPRRTAPVNGVFFDFHMGENVPVPTAGGGRRCVSTRLVFSLNGMGVGDAASRAMAAVAEKALRAAGVDPAKVRFVVPHQAGTGIVRLAANRLEMIGVRGELVNGLTRRLGNISSSSVPQAVRSAWDRLDGIILCPTAGVGSPGAATVTQGCVILETTQTHRLAVAVERDLSRAS